MTIPINKRIIITKKIAKHGRQSVIVIPKAIENSIPPGTLAQITIDVIEENLEDKTGGTGK